MDETDKNLTQLLQDAADYRSKNAHTRALSYLDMAERACNPVSDFEVLNYIRHEQALNHMELENYNDAEEYLTKAEQGYLKKGDKVNLAACRMHKAELLTRQEDFFKALDMALITFEMIRDEHLNDQIINIYDLLAYIYGKLNFHYDALKYYTRILNLLEKEGSNIEKAFYKKVSGDCYSKIFLPDEAEDCYTFANKIYLEEGVYNEATKCMQSLLKIYESRGKKRQMKDLSEKMFNINTNIISRNP